MTFKDVIEVLKKLNNHNEEQRVITRVNEPMLKQCREIADKITAKGIKDDKLQGIIDRLNTYLSTGKGLNEIKAEVEEHLIFTAQEKMGELDAYKY